MSLYGYCGGIANTQAWLHLNDAPSAAAKRRVAYAYGRHLVCDRRTHTARRGSCRLRIQAGRRPLSGRPDVSWGSLTVVSIVDLVGWESQQQKRHDNQTAACAREINVPVQAVREAQTRPHDPLLALDANPVYLWSYAETVKARCRHLDRGGWFRGPASRGATVIYVLVAVALLVLWRGHVPMSESDEG